jgi:hypothetical protein
MPVQSTFTNPYTFEAACPEGDKVSTAKVFDGKQAFSAQAI